MIMLRVLPPPNDSLDLTHLFRTATATQFSNRVLHIQHMRRKAAERRKRTYSPV